MGNDWQDVHNEIVVLNFLLIVFINLIFDWSDFIECLDVPSMDLVIKTTGIKHVDWCSTPLNTHLNLRGIDGVHKPIIVLWVIEVKSVVV